jgi:TonB family protein
MIGIVAALALQIGNPNGSRTAQSSSEFQRQLQDNETHSDESAPANPVALKTPTNADLLAAYPPDALAKKISGTGTIHCTIDKTGALTACKVTAESPSKAGFGDAALKMSKAFQFSPKASNGSDIVGKALTIPLKFTPP